MCAYFWDIIGSRVAPPFLSSFVGTSVCSLDFVWWLVPPRIKNKKAHTRNQSPLYNPTSSHALLMTLPGRSTSFWSTWSRLWRFRIRCKPPSTPCITSAASGKEL